MKRRSFFKTSTAIAGIGLTTSACANSTDNEIEKSGKVITTIDQHKVFFYAEVIKESIKVVHIADTHLFMDDEEAFHTKSIVIEWQRHITKRLIFKREWKQTQPNHLSKH